MTVYSDTRPYERSHCKAPRGLGSWAFAPSPNEDVASSRMLWSPSMTYGEAKRWAKLEAANRRLFGANCGTLYVMP